jgi:hypothetical protein
MLTCLRPFVCAIAVYALNFAALRTIAQKYMRWHHVDRSLPRARPVAFVMSHEWLWLL